MDCGFENYTPPVPQTPNHPLQQETTNMTDVLVSENILGPAMDDLRKRFQVAFQPQLWQQPQALADQVADVRALIVRNQTRVNAPLIQNARQLKIIARAGAGLDNIDVPAVRAAGIVLTYTPVQTAISVAELTLALLLALARKIPLADRHVKSGGWDRHAHSGMELFGKTLGIVGLGRIGFLTAMRAKAFGMKILAHDPLVDPHAPTVAETRAELVDLDTLLAHSHCVACHLPSNEQTRGMFDDHRFRQMMPGALFVNVARGNLVDEPALVRALQEGRIAAAALDVRASEPPPPGPLDAMDNVILLPHIGAFTREAQQRVVAAACRDVTAVLEGRPPANPVPLET